MNKEEPVEVLMPTQEDKDMFALDKDQTEYIDAVMAAVGRVLLERLVVEERGKG